MPRARLVSWNRLRRLLVATDLLLLSLGLCVAYWLRFRTSLGSPLTHPAPAVPVRYVVFIGVVWALVFIAHGVYTRSNLVSGIDEYRRVANAGMITTLAIIVGSYLRTHPYISRGFLLLALICVTMLVSLGRFAIRRLIYRLATKSRYLDRVIIVGSNHQAVAVARQLAQSAPASSDVVGFLSEDLPFGSQVTDSLLVLGEPMDLDQVAREHRVTKAVVIESALSWESLQQLVRWMHRRDSVEIALVPGLFDLHATSMRAHHTGPILTLVPRAARIEGFDAALKRCLDLSVGAAALLLALPLMLGFAAYSVARGRGMGVVADSLLGRRSGITAWSFVSPSWARRAHLSRLPSLLKVMRGPMSLVGPRPIRADARTINADWAALVETAKPGFIGPWWLVGMHRPVDLEEELAYDVYYLRNYSIWFDLHILVQAARGLTGFRVAALRRTSDHVKMQVAGSANLESEPPQGAPTK